MIVINGDEIDIGVPSLNWSDHGLPMHDGVKGLGAARGALGIRRRLQSADIGVIHWTAAENPAATVWRTLCARGLSVHFVIDRDGIVYQFVDPAIYSTAHAGSRVNGRSVGIEVVSYGHARSARPPDPQRPRYRDTVHGWTTTMADFYPVQYDSLYALCDTISRRLPIPLKVPSASRRKLGDDELLAFSGWLGHYHVTTRTKIDPGPRVFEALQEHWCIGV